MVSRNGLILGFSIFHPDKCNSSDLLNQDRVEADEIVESVIIIARTMANNTILLEQCYAYQGLGPSQLILPLHLKDIFNKL